VARIRFAEQAKITQMQVEAERLRNSLPQCHFPYLRTPLATIIGSASTLLEGEGTLQTQDKLDFKAALLSMKLNACPIFNQQYFRHGATRCRSG